MTDGAKINILQHVLTLVPVTMTFIYIIYTVDETIWLLFPAYLFSCIHIFDKWQASLRLSTAPDSVKTHRDACGFILEV